jgi:hypothetical protein
MKPNNEDIQAELEFQRDLINELKNRRRGLERQMARFGDLYVPPFIMQEIAELTKQLAVREQELSKLETKSVEGKLPLAEVEFRVLVAQCWRNSSGWLSTVEESQLELARLRLGITEARAEQHNVAVRSRLAVETLLDLELNDIQSSPETRTAAVQRIVRAFRFDPKATEELLGVSIDIEGAQALTDWITSTRTVWRSRKEYQDLKSLLNRLLQHKLNAATASALLGDTPLTWKGQYTYGDTSRQIPMIIQIDRTDQTHFSGKIEWPEKCTITEMRGQQILELVDSFEQQRWAHISEFQAGNDQIRLRFSEKGYLKGRGTQLNCVYYALVSKDGSIAGKLFLTQGATRPAGVFRLHLRD